MVVTKELFAAYLNCPTKAISRVQQLRQSRLNLGGGKGIFKLDYDNKG